MGEWEKEVGEAFQQIPQLLYQQNVGVGWDPNEGDSEKVPTSQAKENQLRDSVCWISDVENGREGIGDDAYVIMGRLDRRLHT